jgi:hypothetical protein
MIAVSHQYCCRSRSGAVARSSNQTYFVKFLRDDVLIERLHDVFVGAALERPRDVRHIILGRAKNDFGPVAARQAP